jgi:hypothetical protein
VDQEAVHDLERALLEVLVCAVDRVPRLEAHHRAPPAAFELGPRLSGRLPVLDEVVVRRQRDDLEGAGDAAVAGLAECLHPGVLEVLGPEDGRRLLRAVPLEDLADPQDGEGLFTFGGDERNGVGAAQPVGAVLVDGEGHGDRPGKSVLEVHRLEHRVVVGLTLEAGERRERADGEHLEVGELAFGDDERREVAGFVAQGLRVLGDELHEGSPVWIDGGHGRSSFPDIWS